VPACATTLPDTCTPGPDVALSGWSTDHPDIAGLGDWTRTPPCERFAGTVTYRAAFELDAASDLLLDLGKVGDAASIRVNGEPVAASFWAPYRCRIATQATVAGENIVEVAVTNSMANRYEGALLPSGLLGPVRLNLAVPSA
ncbi:MAG: glycosylhydrolase-like jelly roll fold domain-containing protein, partial [Propioniciclava sp.]